MEAKRFGNLVLTPVTQSICKERINNIPAEVKNTLQYNELFANVKPGDTVCIGVPSRGIACMSTVVKTVVTALQGLQAKPFIVPAMGSHGGGTAAGQTAVLAEYGMDENTVGIPINSDTEAVKIGDTRVLGKQTPIYWDRFAAKADHILVINRIKEHTAFTGPVESGLMKILALGLGKPRGATIIHQAGLKETMPVVADWLIKHLPILGGIAIVENGLHEAMRIEAVPAERIASREPELLELARAVLPRLPFQDLDVLIIGKIGKDISGTGMDTNVIGKYRRNWGEASPNYQCIIALDLTDASQGNATGVGFADIITQQLFDKIDLQATRLNCLTAGNFNGAKIPMIAKDIDEAVEWALRGFGENPRVVYINSTLDLETFWVSKQLIFAEKH
ncbi:MAG: DUF2088 domain-containing protein [Anaerolineae bacterium]|nr:DUF2088 domain-containing protein [Anaerolineae bacterium]